MLSELKLYQYKHHDLVQITDGRGPTALEDYRDGWQFRETMPATAEAISRVAASSPSKLLDEVDLRGWAQIAKFEIQESWKRRWVRAG